MFICVCNALTDRQLREVCCEPNSTVADVYRFLGCSLKCGRCVESARQLLRSETLVAADEASA